MMTDPASAIKREVHHLIDLQIETLRQESTLNASQLLGYKARVPKKSELSTQNWIVSDGTPKT